MDNVLDKLLNSIKGDDGDFVDEGFLNFQSPTLQEQIVDVSRKDNQDKNEKISLDNLNGIETKNDIYEEKDVLIKREGGDEDKSLTKTEFWNSIYNKFVQLCQKEFTVNELMRPNESIRKRAESLIDKVLEEEKRGIASGRVQDITPDQEKTYRQMLIGYTFGLGPLDYLFYDKRGITDIHIISDEEDGKMVGYVFVTHKKGKEMEPITVDPYEIIDILRKQLGLIGRSLTESTPIVDGRLFNGVRVNATINPVCDPLLSVSLRIPNLSASNIDFLVDNGFLTVQAASFLYLCVRARLNIVIAGSTGTGKTTLLNALCQLAMDDDRFVSVEDVRELQIEKTEEKKTKKRNWTKLVTVVNHQGEVLINQSRLVKNTLRMMPDRIIMGEVRDGAAWDAIHAASTGHRGTMLTIHADDEESIFRKLALLCEMGGANLSRESLLEEIGQTIQIAIYIQRKRVTGGGYKRYVNSIIESNGLFRDGRINLQPYFKHNGTTLVWQNYMPHPNIMARFIDAGITLDIIKEAVIGEKALWREPEYQKLGS